MKHLTTVPICSNALFIYKLDIKEDWTLKFNEEKFNVVHWEGTTSLISEDLDILKNMKLLKKKLIGP